MDNKPSRWLGLPSFRISAQNRAPTDSLILTIWARQEPHVVTRQLEDVLQQVKGQSLAASQSIELAPAV
jgi:hypothetical protein